MKEAFWGLWTWGLRSGVFGFKGARAECLVGGPGRGAVLGVAEALGACRADLMGFRA